MACSFYLVDPRRIELLSENLFTGPSSWTVCGLKFPLDGDHRQPSPAGSPFMHDRYKCELPIHVHHYVTPRPRPWYSPVGRAAIMPRHCLIRQPDQQDCCRLIFKVGPLTGLPGLTRLSHFMIPVETGTPPDKRKVKSEE